MIYATLTLNSTTLYTYENYQLLNSVGKLNSSEIVSQELGLINASKTLVGCIPIADYLTTPNTELVLYFMKKVLYNRDGSNDLVTTLCIAHATMNRTLILTILKKIMDRYIEFSNSKENNIQNSGASAARLKSGEFKLYMTQIIRYEEMNYESNYLNHGYGSTDNQGEGANGRDVVLPSQLVLANEEAEDVRQLMLDNINRVMNRGDKINSLVNQTDELTTSSLLFQKKAQQIRKKMWLSKSKILLIIIASLLVFAYLGVGLECGLPFYSHCFKNT